VQVFFVRAGAVENVMMNGNQFEITLPLGYHAPHVHTIALPHRCAVLPV
jgi:hypothetical protein